MILDLRAAIEDVRASLFRGQFQYAESILSRLFKKPQGRTGEMTAARLERICRTRRKRFHPWHLAMAVEPFLEYVRGHPQAMADLDRPGSRMEILAQAVIQNGSPRAEALARLKEVVEDMYEGFLDDDMRGKIRGPTPGTAFMPPLVEWTLTSDMRPFTLDVRKLRKLGVHAGVIGMPKAFADGGLLVWASLAHEACGHGVLNAYDGLLDQIRQEVKPALDRKFATGKHSVLPEYWDRCFEEAVADCLGLLRMGPAMAAGFIGAFRSGRAFMAGALGADADLPGLGWEDYDRTHPSDIYRAFLMASVVGRMAFGKRSRWRKALLDEIGKDIALQRLPVPQGIPWGQVRESADIFAEKLFDARLESLQGFSLGRLRNWTDADEESVSDLKDGIRSGDSPASDGSIGVTVPAGFTGLARHDATHAVSAAILLAVSPDNRIPIPVIFRRLMAFIKGIHAAKNPEPAPMSADKIGRRKKGGAKQIASMRMRAKARPRKNTEQQTSSSHIKEN